MPGNLDVYDKTGRICLHKPSYLGILSPFTYYHIPSSLEIELIVMFSAFSTVPVFESHMSIYRLTT